MDSRTSYAIFVLISMISLITIVFIPVSGTIQEMEDVLAPNEDGVIYTEPIDIGRPNRIAVIEIAGFGTIKIELYDNMTPITTQNFVDLASTGFYDGIRFHRCIDNFVAQTGDPNTKNANPYDDGSGGSGITIPLEICVNATHIDGAVGMARSAEPDSASSQFYICDGPQHGLDDEKRMADGNGHGYAVFGVVIEGLDIAKSIAGTETNGYKRPLLKDQPVDDITMTRVYIEEPEWENVTDQQNSTREASKGGVLPSPGIGMISGVILIAVIIIRRKI